MHFFLRHATHQAIAVLVLGLAVIPSARAQTTAGAAFDPAALDVAGVRLGMTVDEAATGLKGFDPTFAVTKRYLQGPTSGFGGEGTPLDQIAESDRSTSYLNDFYAIKGEATQVCRPVNPGIAGPADCNARHDDDEEIVRIWFSHVPNGERVIAVQRQKTFYKEPKPTVVSLRDSVFAKYAKDQITYDTKDGWNETMSWLFDVRRRLMSRETARRKNIRNFGGLPQFAGPSDGIDLNVVLQGNNRNNLIADSLLVTLFDGSTLYKSIAEGQAEYKALKARADAIQAQKAAKSQSQTKF